MATIAVVIPAYNEATTIRDVAAAACAESSFVIVVDDGSQDDTCQHLHDLPVVLLRNQDNRGKGASLWRGMQHAVAEGADAVITLDGDGQHAPKLIPRLVAAHLQHPDRIIIAARLLARERMPKNRRFGNEVADFWIGWAAGWPVFDSQSGFRLYPSALLRDSQLDPGKWRSFVFESEILIDAARRGYSPMALAIEAVYAADARPSHYRPWVDTLRIIAMVTGKLVSRGMDPMGLVRSRRHPVEIFSEIDITQERPAEA